MNLLGLYPECRALARHDIPGYFMIWRGDGTPLAGHASTL
jgi:hypothetical protein